MSPPVHSREALLARRAERRRRYRRRRLAAGTLLIAATALLLPAGGLRGHSGHPPGRPAPKLLVGPASAPPLPFPSSARLEAREQRAIERSIERLPYVALAGRRRRELALTFDDGPGPYTVNVIDALRRLRAAATFFQIGFMIPLFPKAERAARGDHRIVLGDHTDTHPQLARLPARAQDGQITVQAQELRKAGAPYPRLFRPPFGSFNRATEALARRKRMLIVLWSVDSQDYRRPGVPAVVHNVLAGARPGAIVLMHDAGGERSQTVAALPTIIHALRKRGYRLVTVPRLLADNPPPRRQPPVPSGIG